MRALASAELREHFGEILRTDVEVFADASPQQRGRNVGITALLLQLLQHVQHDSLLASQCVADIWYPVVAHRRAVYILMVKDGFAIIHAVLDGHEVDAIARDLAAEILQRSRGGARHLLSVPAVAALARDARLSQLAADVLGCEPLPFGA